MSNFFLLIVSQFNNVIFFLSFFLLPSFLFTEATKRVTVTFLFSTRQQVTALYLRRHEAGPMRTHRNSQQR